MVLSNLMSIFWMGARFLFRMNTGIYGTEELNTKTIFTGRKVVLLIRALDPINQLARSLLHALLGNLTGCNWWCVFLNIFFAVLRLVSLDSRWYGLEESRYFFVLCFFAKILLLIMMLLGSTMRSCLECKKENN